MGSVREKLLLIVHPLFFPKGEGIFQTLDSGLIWVVSFGYREAVETFGYSFRGAQWAEVLSPSVQMHISIGGPSHSKREGFWSLGAFKGLEFKV